MNAHGKYPFAYLTDLQKQIELLAFVFECI